MAINSLPFKFIPPSNHWYNVSIHSYCPECYSANFEIRYFFEQYVDVRCECGWIGDKYDMLICTEYEYNQKYLKKHLRLKKLERIINNS